LLLSGELAPCRRLACDAQPWPDDRCGDRAACWQHGARLAASPCGRL